MSELDRTLTLTRILDAPREVVFTAWTDADHLGWFLNPGQETSQPIEVDLQVGGSWRLEMVIDHDTRYMTGGIYREIDPPGKLVFTWGAVGGWPEIIPGRDDAPVVTITLNDLGDRTEMIFEVRLSDQLSDQEVERWYEIGLRKGWTETVQRLVTRYAVTAHS